MKTLFITNKKLKKYRRAISSLANFLWKRTKDNNEFSQRMAMAIFIKEYNNPEIDFSSLDHTGNNYSYKYELLGTILHKAYTEEAYTYFDVIEHFLFAISKIENVNIMYVEHLFKTDSLLERYYEDISYSDYIKHLKNKYNYSDEKLKEMTKII